MLGTLVRRWLRRCPPPLRGSRPGTLRRGRPCRLAAEALEHRNLLSFVWNIVPSPNPLGTVYNPLNGVATVAENDVWAVGEAQLPNSASQTLTQHWSGTAWSIVPSPNPPGNIG